MIGKDVTMKDQRITVQIVHKRDQETLKQTEEPDAQLKDKMEFTSQRNFTDSYNKKNTSLEFRMI